MVKLSNMALGLAAVSLASVPFSAAKKVPWPYGETFSGDGTYYGPTDPGSGHCAMRGDMPDGVYNDMIGVAIGASLYGDSGLCGACIEGTASGVGSGTVPLPTTFKAYVMDECPECGSGSLDFGISGDGRWDIEWKFVKCPRGENKNKPGFIFEGSNDYYWKIQPYGTRSPVKKLWVNGNKPSRTKDNFLIIEPPSGETFDGTQLVKTKTIRKKRKRTKMARD